ncbi:MAG: (d)CMP kinase [Elusimicrobiota bacterium]|nr:(d)CMP kinase [Elusimicrobiota bacterium]
MKNCIIAIDGPAGAGKSTIAKIVAKRLGYLYIDSGAMYRALTWKALKEKIDLRSGNKALTELAKKTKIDLEHKDDKLKIYVDGVDVTGDIRSEKVSKYTNAVASVLGVRKVLRSLQRKTAKKNNIVMEGRDIGTCVFPNANFKFYLDASPKERAKRRYRELKARGDKEAQKVNFKQIEKAIARRDFLDKTRGINPLKEAKDAVKIDTTNMTLSEVAEFILNHIAKSSGSPQASV